MKKHTLHGAPLIPDNYLTSSRQVFFLCVRASRLTLSAVESRPPGAAATLAIGRTALRSVVTVAGVDAVWTPGALGTCWQTARRHTASKGTCMSKGAGGIKSFHVTKTNNLYKCA